MFSSLWDTHPVVMGFDFIVIAPLLLSHCGFSFVFGCGVSFLVSSSVFLSMIVQQLVAILVLSREGVSARPSTPPSWTNLRKTPNSRTPYSRSPPLDVFSFCLYFTFIFEGLFFLGCQFFPQHFEHVIPLSSTFHIFFGKLHINLIIASSIVMYLLYDFKIFYCLWI